MKVALIIAGIVALSLGIVEVALRTLFGFGKPPLYMADPHMGYRLAPNQRTKRFGNEFAINQFSMRGPAIALRPDPHTLRILLLGDSIANGGWWTDQANILSAQIQQRLSDHLQLPYTTVEVLNASANSWGPRNELAYVTTFGTFHAHLVVLLLNTDDWFAVAPTSLPVGRDRNYPTTYPPLALTEVITRLRKPGPMPELQAVQQEGGDRVGKNLDAIRQLQHITHVSDCRLMVALTPLRREVTAPGPRDYELQARDRVQQWMSAEDILYIDFLDPFKSVTEPQALYRDHIHLSPAGNALVSQTLSDMAQSVISSPQGTHPSLPDSLLGDPWQ